MLLYNGIKLYSFKKYKNFKLVKNMGFSLGVIREILQKYEDVEALKTYLTLKKCEIKEHTDVLTQQLVLLEATLNRLGKDGVVMNYNVTLKELPKRYVASVRKVIPSYNHEMDLWKILVSETAALNMQNDEPCYTLAIFHDGEYKENDIDVEVQKSVKGNYKNIENVVFKTVEPIQMASATYKGNYDQVTAVNEVVANWVRDNGYEFNGLSFCIYHVSPHETQNPDEWVTEVCYPVKLK